jgi:hypothetical protein
MKLALTPPHLVIAQLHSNVNSQHQDIYNIPGKLSKGGFNVIGYESCIFIKSGLWKCIAAPKLD